MKRTHVVDAVTHQPIGHQFRKILQGLPGARDLAQLPYSFIVGVGLTEFFRHQSQASSGIGVGLFQKLRQLTRRVGGETAGECFELPNEFSANRRHRLRPVQKDLPEHTVCGLILQNFSGTDGGVVEFGLWYI